MARKEKVLLTDEQVDKLENDLSAKHGEIEEDWIGFRICIKGVEKYYAFKQPTRVQYLEFKRNVSGLVYGSKASKGVHVDSAKLDYNLLIDCLIHPTHKEFEADVELRPMIVDSLGSAFLEFCTESGQISKKA